MLLGLLSWRQVKVEALLYIVGTMERNREGGHALSLFTGISHELSAIQDIGRTKYAKYMYNTYNVKVINRSRESTSWSYGKNIFQNKNH